MKKKVFLAIGLLAFLMLMAGATLLYNRLSENASPGNLMTGSGIIAEKETKAADETELETETEAETQKETVTDETETASEKETETEQDLHPAPDFTVYDAENNAVKLSDFKGKPVIVNFWASWCPPCKSEMPDFQEAFEEYGDQIQFMMVNLTDGSQETVESASEFIKSQGYTFPVFYDTEMSAAMAYGASSIPASYFVNADGNLKAYAVGMIDRNALDTGIGMILE